MITSQPLDHEDDDDQLFLTKIFLNPDNRSKWNMKLDSRSQVFQTLNGIPAGEVEIQFDDLTGDAFMVNTMTKTRPLVIHGNGASKMHLNSLSNYLPRSWNSQTGCLSCLEDQTESLMKMSADEGDVEANNKKEEIVQEEGIESVGVEREAATPGGRLVIGIFIQRPTPFLPQFFHHVHALNYPKDWIDLVIYSPIHYHDQHVQHFLGHNVTGEYHSVRVIGRHGHKVLKNKGEDERKAIEPSGAEDVAAAAVRQGLSKEGKDASGSSPHLESLTGSSSDQVVTEAEARTMGL